MDRYRWRAIVVVGALVSVGVLLAPGDLRGLIAMPFVGVGVGLAWGRARKLDDSSKGPWFTFAAAGTIIVSAAVLRSVHGLLIDESAPLPSPADALFLSGYVLLIVAGVRFLRERSQRRDPDAWTDAFIAAGFVGVLTFIVLLLPYLSDDSVSIAERSLNLVYACLSLVLFAVIVRVIHAPGLRVPSYYLLGLAASSFLVLDLLSTIEYARNWQDDYGLLLTVPTYTLFVAALFHPSVGLLTEAPPDQEPRLSLLRTASLAVASIVPAIALTYELQTPGSANAPALIGASFVMAVLVTYRLYQLVQARERMADRAEALRLVGEQLIGSTSADEILVQLVRAARNAESSEVLSAVVVGQDDGEATAQLLASAGDEQAGLEHVGQLDLDADERTTVTRIPGPALQYVVRLGDMGAQRLALVVTCNTELDRQDRRSLDSLARESVLAIRAIEATSQLAQEASERRLQELVRNSSDIFFVLDEGTRSITYVSPAVSTVLGRSPDELTEKPFSELIHSDHRLEVDRALSRSTLSAPPRTLEARLVARGERTLWFDLVVSQPTAEAEAGGIVVNARETTDRRAAARRLQESEARFKALVQNSSDLVAVTDREGRFTYVSPSSKDVLDAVPEDLIGTNAFDLVATSQHPELLGLLETSVLGSAKPVPIELNAQSVQGRRLVLDVTITDLSDDPSVSGIVVNARDITVSHKLELDLRYAAYHDALTSLPNRLLLTRRIEDALTDMSDSLGGAALLFIDLDDFKTINDGLGHSIGDEVLNVVANRLKDSLRVKDTAARLGGDEFAILVPECLGESDVLGLADRILERIAEPIEVQGRELHITASVGVAIEMGEGTALTLLRDADTAMYKAKENGKNRAELFEAQLQAFAIERLELTNDLRAAIDETQLFCLYQPIVRLDSAAMVGAEALVRWQHPERGVLGPGAFIELAEQTGLIVPLGRWVMNAACRQLQEWDERGLDQTMSVNLSARQLVDAELIADIDRAIVDTGIDPAALCVEVTESVLIDDSDFFLERLRAIRDLGVSLAVDDFGTGYSSLSYLRRYPFSRLKIDRSFVQAIVGRPGDRDIEIIRAIVDLAGRLKVDVVAEGIESSEEREVLRSIGCELGQGFYFARPSPAAELDEMLVDEVAAA